MTAIRPPEIFVHGQVVPGPFKCNEPVHLWIKAHWDNGEPWTHRADGTDEDVPQLIDAPQVLFEDATGPGYNVRFRAESGLSGEQKEAILALPIPKLKGEWKGKPVFEDQYLEPWASDDKDVYLYNVKRRDLQAVISGLVEILSWPRDCDIDYAPVSDEIAVAILSGVHPTRPERYNNDRSRLVAACAVAMDQAGMAEWEIRSVLLNPKYKISAHCFENGGIRAVDNVIKFVRSVRRGKA